MRGDQSHWSVHIDKRERQQELEAAANKAEVHLENGNYEAAEKIYREVPSVAYHVEDTSEVKAAADLVKATLNEQHDTASAGTAVAGAGSKVSMFERMRKARADMPGDDIASATLPDLGGQFAAAHDNIQKEPAQAPITQDFKDDLVYS